MRVYGVDRITAEEMLEYELYGSDLVVIDDDGNRVRAHPSDSQPELSDDQAGRPDPSGGLICPA